MTVNHPTKISYWRWAEPPGSEASPASPPQPSLPGDESLSKPPGSETSPASPPQPSLPGDESLSEPKDLIRKDFLQKDFLRMPGIHVIFMPKVEEGILNMEGSVDLRKQLTEKFFLPNFFFERMGWNANGMFGSADNLLQNDSEMSYGTFSRFLSKQVKEKDAERALNPGDPSNTNSISTSAPEFTYDWHYMAFCTLWRSSLSKPTGDSGQVRTDESTDETNVILCFDLDDDITLRLRRLLHKTDFRNWKNEPFLMLGCALNIVIDQCEKDLWSFQRPVRDIERSRSQDLFRETGSSDNDKTFEFLVKRYSRLHELSRHVIHISESMDATSNNLGAIVRDYNVWIQSNFPFSPATTQLSKSLLLYENIITNLNFRAKAFVSRMDNEIKCASNFVNVANSNISKGILKQTRNEGQFLSETVSALTLLFLPGTFISGFFGMNFFILDENEKSQILQWKTHPKIWIFFACTIPITMFGFFAYLLKFNSHDFIRDIKALIDDICCQSKTPDVEKNHANNLRGLQRNFGFSRRATLRSRL